MSAVATKPKRSRVVIVGAGHVGSTFAYTLLLGAAVEEIVLVDSDARRAEGEAMDLAHAIPFASTVEIVAGDLGACASADVTVVTAGAAQRPGETRLALLERNAAVFRETIPAIAAQGGGILVIATNPVDALSYLAWRLSGTSAARVIGSGTILDTARFRFLIGRHYGVDPSSVHAYVVGEHGDSEVPAWSTARVGGMTLPDYCAARGMAPGAMVDDIARATREAAYRIIERKGATYFAVAAGLARIVQTILHDRRSVLPVSTLVDGIYGIRDVYLSLPTVIGAAGVEHVLPIELDPHEVVALQRSAEVLRTAIARVMPGSVPSAR